jgi:N-sulfoglucosamine sulfohydrolase
MQHPRRLSWRVLSLLASGVTAVAVSVPLAQAEAMGRPNILWLYIEDMNPSLGCYGDSTVTTPHMDSLAKQGVLFEKCFVTAPVCSPCRSAIITGRMQTTIGAHNHRSGSNRLPEYLRVHTLPELIRKNGYNTFNAGKDDYNFSYRYGDLYSTKAAKNRVSPWRGLKRVKAGPFFGQIQLRGGKSVFGKEGLAALKKRTSLADAEKTLPPYYPRDPIILKHWALHYDAIRMTDMHVGKILQALKEDGLLENTIIFCFSDHGCYMPRHKQFCYEGGLHVPLIISIPKEYAKAGRSSRRKEIVSAMDVSATSLAFANIKIPQWYDSKNLFVPDYKREFVIAAKDRMDSTVDRVRSIRTAGGIKYIRNFMTDRPYWQENFRSKRDYAKRMVQLYREKKLTPGQAWFWGPDRPSEELYDLNKDPYELHNRADDPEYRAQLRQMRAQLDKWVKETDDKGQYPEERVPKEDRKGWQCVGPRETSEVTTWTPADDNHKKSAT